LLKYGEMKEILEKYPYCFQPIDEQKKEFDQKVANSEMQPIIFAENTDQ